MITLAIGLALLCWLVVDIEPDTGDLAEWMELAERIVDGPR